MREHGKILRQGDLVLVEFHKHHRRVFLFENTIILTKKRKPKNQVHEVASSERFDFKQAYKVYTYQSQDVCRIWCVCVGRPLGGGGVWSFNYLCKALWGRGGRGARGPTSSPYIHPHIPASEWPLYTSPLVSGPDTISS